MGWWGLARPTGRSFGEKEEKIQLIVVFLDGQ
jgi:hypothetical protein